jgi:hypothetical protein
VYERREEKERREETIGRGGKGGSDQKNFLRSIKARIAGYVARE